MSEYEDQGPLAHPYLHEPLLHVSQLPQYVSDVNLAAALLTCSPFKLNIPRDGSGNLTQGTIQFKYIENAEKALATLQSRALPDVPTVALVLSPYPPTHPPTPLPPPSALPRLIKYLPPGYTDSQLYDIFRPYGALASARTHTQFGPDAGVVEFWSEDDARIAEEALHCADVEGQNIAVQVYQPPRRNTSEFSINAPTFVPGGPMFGGGYATQYSPTRASPYQPHSPLGPAPFVHGPGQQVQLAPPIGPGSNSQSGLIDPCNLFCKNLDPAIDSNGLFAHFRQFGQIVSARVMRNESGESRGFGFVSYQTPDQANAAMNAMNGATLGSKPVVVRLHEPKQLRQEKLAHRFGQHNGHPRSASGATSPTASEGGDSIAGWGSPRQRTSQLASPDRPGQDRGRRGSGSYYNAALTGTLNVPMRYDELSALSPVVRKEVLKGELSRRIRALDTTPTEEVDSVVDVLVALSLSEVIQAIHDPVKLTDRVERVQSQLHPSTFGARTSTTNERSKSPSPSGASVDSRLLDPNALAATASAPEHPSTPVSISPAPSTPPRTESPSGSVPPAATERERISGAVSRIESERIAELTDLLMSLPKRERAMCLFNVEILRAKIADAKIILDLDDDEEEEVVPTPPQTRSKSAPAPVTPKKAASAQSESSPHTPELSSRGPSAAASPVPVTPGGATYTLASLAKLPAAEIVRIVRSANGPGFPLEKADPLVVKATDEFIDGLMDKNVLSQKQLLGEKLWRAVKAFGIKGAPKLTVTLLDQDDLRSLAHLMNSYPSVLKEKVLLAQSSTK